VWFPETSALVTLALHLPLQQAMVAVLSAHPLVLVNPIPSGRHVASAARIMSGHGSGAGLGRTSSASQSGTTASRIAAARVLIGAGLRLSLIASPPPRLFSTERTVVTATSQQLFTHRWRIPAVRGPAGFTASNRGPRPLARACPGPWQSSRMDESRYLECLAADHGDLRDAAASVELTVPVPNCPGWTMGDLVFHVAEVYLHKVTVMRTGEWPRQWPPPGAEHEAPLPLLGRGYGQLIAEFGAHRPTDAVPTWYDPDQTVAFWIRRMAQETVIHRIDAEQAAGLPVTGVPDDLAVDGVDEVLKRFLGYDSEALGRLEGDHLASDDGQDTITVMAGQTAWTVRPSPRGVVVDDGASDDPRVVIQAAPDPTLRWLWGRAGDDTVRLTGEKAWAAYLRCMLAATTQ
jgi:uncharacterized protein (TIGR03083 family)